MVPRWTKRWQEGDLEGDVPAPANAYPPKERNFHPFGFQGQPSPPPQSNQPNLEPLLQTPLSPSPSNIPAQTKHPGSLSRGKPSPPCQGRVF